MTKYKIVTDSTSDLPQSFLQQHDVHVIPLNITIDQTSYTDQLDITSDEFLKRLEAGADTKTSQPAIGQFIETYNNLGADGSKIISIHMTSQLSGTYQTAVQASHMSDSDVTVVDSQSISFGLGYQIKHLIEWTRQGLTVDEILKKIRHLQDNTKLFVVIGQLSQLIKGGRISKTKGLIGNMIKIKPIGTLIDGRLEMIHNSRTQKSVIQFLKKEVHQFIEGHQLKSVGIAHANIIEFVDKIKEQFKEEFQFDDFDVNTTTPVISNHTGQGAIGFVVVRESI
ncbi:MULTISPECIES: DegV family protein [Staphylococcus]|uniref:DegV family protein n=1 Tax=Staphylococcus pettenkoferi TaxID=170573 RepID=A0A2N6QJQ3_9STAP|nr:MULTISPECIES: DegV family protein [Staphylococcus]MBX8992508.1 DegV family protein [Staphylococcus pettenkoferi]MCI2790390.1 DegV family protein [Staphylococcus pettenkoferi]MCY1566052.1 DegV family protein [Staphylococcus pettenkoferi]MCY1587071.1 DegV family protein [Staphylococcus pettenkoferi]MCY1603745.1 DegV family protein [Staphylococcus pettenkoferi]